MMGKSAIAGGRSGTLGLIAIGPDVIVLGGVLRTARSVWTIGVERFVFGDLTTLRRFADSFSELSPADCYACVQAEGVGRMLVDAPTTDLTSGVVVELHVAAPVPLSEARKRFDANLRGTDIALALSGDEPGLGPMFSEVSGADTIAQTLIMHLSTCKGGWCVGGDAGSRVADLYRTLGPEHVTAVIAIETIRLATVPHEDALLKKSYVPFDFVERVRSAQMLPPTSPDWLKVGITLDVFGVGRGLEYVVLISTSTEHIDLPPPRFVLADP